MDGGHAKRNISCLDESECLLFNQTKFLLCSNNESTLFGCYLFFDENNNIWIRSGKATGVGGIVGRLAEHKSRAKSNWNEDESRFYHVYPSVVSSRSENRGTSMEGNFKDLVAMIAVGFDGSDDGLATLFSKDYHNDGIFFYTQDELASVRRTNFRGKDSNKKFMEMIAYLFELGYDLALARLHNVSDSPGFEGCGLIFDKKV